MPEKLDRLLEAKRDFEGQGDLKPLLEMLDFEPDLFTEAISAAECNRAVLQHVNELLKQIQMRPRMFGGTMHATELLVSYLLDIWALASGRELVMSWREWLNQEYLDVPGPVRSLASAARARHGGKENAAAVTFFTQELRRMIEAMQGAAYESPNEEQDP